MPDESVVSPMAARQGTGKSLLFPVIPRPGETLLGYIVRSVEENHLPNATTVFTEAGLAGSATADALARASLAIPDLATALRQPLSTLQGLWGAEPPVAGRRRLGGVWLRSSMIEGRHRRIPRKLAVGGSDRAIWAVRHLGFCPETWEVLVQKCPTPWCGRPLTWLSAPGLAKCGFCRAEVSEAKTGRIPMPQREALRWVLGLFDDDEGVVARSMASVPPNFELETATDLHELIYALARPMQAFRGVVDNRVQLTDFARACRFVRDFPRSHWDLDQLDLRVRSDFRRRVEGVFQHSTYPVVQTEAKRILEYGRPRRPYVCRKFKQPLFDVTRTASFLGVQRGDVRRLVAAGHLKARPVAGGKSRGHYVVRREDVEALEARLNARMGWRDFCSKASVPTLALEQMLASGMLRPREDPAVMELFGDRQICLPDAEKLLGGFDDLPEEDEGWPALQQVMWGVGGREKPWARVLEAGLTGELPGGLRRDLNRPGLGNLRVHPVTATSLIMGGPDSNSPFAFSKGDYGQYLRLSLRPGEVEVYLNCTAQDVSWLRSRGDLQATNQKGNPTLYSRAEVECLGRRFVTTREIAARLGVKPKEVWLRLEDLRAEAQIGQGFYDRSVIERVISREPRYPAEIPS